MLLIRFRYFLEILPLTDWSQEQSRSALSLILRRLDKTFAKIGKRGGIRVKLNQGSASGCSGMITSLIDFSEAN